MAKESKATQQLTFTGNFKGSTTWITKWGRFEFAEDDHILLHPEAHCQGQVPYEGKITTTCEDYTQPHATQSRCWRSGSVVAPRENLHPEGGSSQHLNE